MTSICASGARLRVLGALLPLVVSVGASQDVPTVLIAHDVAVEPRVVQGPDGEEGGGLKRLMPLATCVRDRPSRRARRESTPPAGTPPRSGRGSRGRPPDR